MHAPDLCIRTPSSLLLGIGLLPCIHSAHFRFGNVSAPLPLQKDEVDDKYSNRVLHDVGLCMYLWDFLQIGDGYIYPGEGSRHYKVLVHRYIDRYR